MHLATTAGTPKKLPVTGLESYFGSKGAMGTYQKIINQVRPCERFVELFLGGGSVTRWMRPAAQHVGVDLNARVIELWQAMGYDWLELHHMSALAYLKHLATVPDLSRTVLYVDPPFPGSVRLSDHNYPVDMRGDAEHLRLLTALLALDQRPDRPDIIISTYPNALYAQLLAGWHYQEYPSMTRGGLVTEALYRNYPEVTALHDPRHLGGGFRERRRMRKMQNRWVAKFNALPLLERQALFAVLAADSSNYGPETARAAESAAPVVPVPATRPTAHGGHPRPIGRGDQVGPPAEPQLNLFDSSSTVSGQPAGSECTRPDCTRADSGAVVEAPAAVAAA